MQSSTLRRRVGVAVLAAATAVGVLAVGAGPASASVPVAFGPVFPPPGGITFSSSGTGAADPGGITYNYSGFDLSAFSQIAWGLDGTPVYVSMEGSVQPSDALAYNVTQSNLAAGVLVYTGSTSMNGVFYSGPVSTKLVVTLTGHGGAPAPFLSQNALPASGFEATLPPSVGTIGGVAPYPSDGSGNLELHANLQFLAAAGIGNPTTAADAFFNSEHPVSPQAISTSVGAGSYWLPPLTITTTSLSDAVKGVAYNANLTATGGGPTPDTWSLASGSLPAGLSLSSAGVISGTPTAVGSSSFTVEVADSSNPAITATRTLSLTVVPLAVKTTSLPNDPVDKAYKTTLAAAGGTPTFTWKVVGGALPKGLTMTTAGVISGTPTLIGTSTFTVQVTDSAKPTKNVATAQLSITIVPMTVATQSLPNAPVGRTYAAKLLTSGGKSTFHWKVISGALPSGIVLSSAGAFSGTPKVVGTSSFTVQVTDSAVPAHVASAALAINVTPMTITTSSLPNAPVGRAYSAKLAASGGQGTLHYKVVAGALPAGIVLSSAGAFSGTPSVVGTSSFTVQLTDSASPARVTTRVLSITVTPLTITTTSLPQATLHKTYAAKLTVSGGKGTLVFTVSAGALPPGIHLSTAGAFSGTPTTAGQFGFTVRVHDSATPQNVATANLAIVVN
jgi:hypothetical protein